MSRKMSRGEKRVSCRQGALKAARSGWAPTWAPSSFYIAWVAKLIYCTPSIVELQSPNIKTQRKYEFEGFRSTVSVGT